jgi:hypothetical protein
VVLGRGMVVLRTAAQHRTAHKDRHGLREAKQLGCLCVWNATFSSHLPGPTPWGTCTVSIWPTSVTFAAPVPLWSAAWLI